MRFAKSWLQLGGRPTNMADARRRASIIPAGGFAMCSRTLRSWSWLLAAALLLAGAGRLTAQDPAKKDPPKLTPGQIQKRTYDFKEAAKEMEYALFVPTKYDKDMKTPLIVALHGLGSNPQQILRYKGFTDLADKHGYLLAAPMGYNSSGWYGVKGQSSPKSTPENLGELSEKDVLNVLAIVRKEFNVDENRIYLLGHSMGGGGTWHLALKYPDLWAGLAPIAPAIFRKPDGLEKIKDIPVILVQGDKDNLVPVAGARQWAARMKELNMTYEYIEVAGGDHINVAFQNMPKIFEFFNKNKKQPKEK
jgi:poly(3-hydroxybutyrate) depolymerase